MLEVRNKTLSLRLTEKEFNTLEAMAESFKTTKSELVHMMIEIGIETATKAIDEVVMEAVEDAVGGKNGNI